VRDRQRILVVSTTASADDVRRLRDDLRADPVVLSAPTADAKQVVTALAVEPLPEVLLAPVRFPDADRGHRLDALVRDHALRDRFRDVVVVADPATTTLLLRVLAPDQLATGGAVTVVGLPRADRPVDLRRAVAVGVLVGVAALFAPSGALLALPVVVAAVGLGLLLIGSWRHHGRGLLVSAGTALVLVFLSVAGSARFPGAW
jgi:hypothetical protein